MTSNVSIFVGLGFLWSLHFYTIVRLLGTPGEECTSVLIFPDDRSGHYHNYGDWISPESTLKKLRILVGG